ncbi:MAG: NAD(+) diphosphatase [Rhizobacter sp.]
MSFVPASRPSPQPSAQAWSFAFVGRDLLVPEAEAISLQPLASAVLESRAQGRHNHGTMATVDCWALSLPEAPPGWRATPLRAAMMALPAEVSAIAGRAAQVIEWDRTHRHCGVCGTPTELHLGERSRVCPSCKHTAYPRVSPAMMALVWRPGELLLARSPHYAKGMYSALAGFVEAGESLEDCVHREVAEEVNVAITDLRYYGSQSWPFPHSLMVAFTARWTGGEIVPQEGEIEDAQWYPIDALPGVPPRFSVSGHLIRDTVEAMREGRLA